MVLCAMGIFLICDKCRALVCPVYSKMCAFERVLGEFPTVMLISSVFVVPVGLACHIFVQVQVPRRTVLIWYGEGKIQS